MDVRGEQDGGPLGDGRIEVGRRREIRGFDLKDAELGGGGVGLVAKGSLGEAGAGTARGDEFPGKLDQIAVDGCGLDHDVFREVRSVAKGDLFFENLQGFGPFRLGKVPGIPAGSAATPGADFGGVRGGRDEIFKEPDGQAARGNLAKGCLRDKGGFKLSVRCGSFND